MAQQPVGLNLTLAPSLRTLLLSCFRISPAIFERVNYKQIINLTFDCISYQLPNLEEAAFHHTTFSQARLFQKIRHQKLRGLEVETHTVNQLKHFLPILILPRLESLNVCVPTTLRYSDKFTAPIGGSQLLKLIIGL